MKTLLSLFLFLMISINSTYAIDEVQGFWKSVDDETGRIQSIVAIYEYEGKYFGRIIATYGHNGEIADSIESPKTRAAGVQGNPFFSGMDIMWNLKKNGEKYTDGKILDPDHGRVYDAQMWPKNGNLIVRGQIFFFGRNQTWLPVAEHDFPRELKKPDLKELVPVIPKVNRVKSSKK
ncbi:MULTISPECIES: DUF2147 domain-containing protein [Parachlamydia]|jgi:uncharacterized protein (DUF2147 family)|uniref:DUF2147 domain-containing protein n=2 Tax=Parachlamydia acanthamoebae TaxID=83552 RepID=F8KYT7_PARAV|nr:DUF2147 domain-containing protein [Parachlamydia acanthamoebae]EFB41085.1 hypothetical protein pah_c050o040 [Parachlamydia acanthamoebae str. Hall's coccus]CCB86047.1 putative uncharacterized protein [Parachlamydia acanthamoebae UV-7]